MANLQHLLDTRRTTHSSVSRAAGLNVGYLGDILRDHKRTVPGVDKVMLIANVLESNILFLLGLIDFDGKLGDVDLQALDLYAMFPTHVKKRLIEQMSVEKRMAHENQHMPEQEVEGVFRYHTVHENRRPFK